jgi:pimeloyl-ACP methyl ester carboxylesterase
MLPPNRQSVSRRGFLAAMLATSAAVGAFALSARVSSAAPWPAEVPGETPGPVMPIEPQDTNLIAHTSRISGAHVRLNQMTPSSTSGMPTVVLVHGAFADSSSFNGVVARLQAQGYPVVAAANPLRGLKADTAYLTSVLKSIPGPVVLVGHSYGGGVITNAATGNGNVVGLVYVSAFAPDEGETLGELTGRLPGSTLGPAQSPPVALPDGGAEVSIQQDKFWQQFAADIPEADAKLAAAAQRPVSLAAFTDVSGPPAWKVIPSRHIYGDRDLNIPPALMSFMAERAGSRETVEIKGGSHVVMISHPDEVAEMIHQSALTYATTRSAA